MRSLSNGESQIGGWAIRSWEGGDALSDRLAENGSDGLGRGEAAGAGEIDIATATSVLGRKAVRAGTGGAGFTGAA